MTQKRQKMFIASLHLLMRGAEDQRETVSRLMRLWPTGKPEPSFATRIIEVVERAYPERFKSEVLAICEISSQPRGDERP